MIKNLLAATSATTVLLVQLAAAESPSPAEHWATPSLPACQPVDEARTPMPIWRPDVTREGRISSAPPRGVMYLDLVANFNVPGCNGSEDGDFVLTAPSARPNAHLRGTKVTFDDGVDIVRGGCIARGFYINAPAAGIRDGWRKAHLHQLNKFEITTSGRYCRADAASVSRPPRVATLGPTSVIRPHSGEVLPACRSSGERRAKVPVWQPDVNDQMGVAAAPPQGDGKLVYIAIDSSSDCSGIWQDRFTDFRLPDDAKDPDAGGLVIGVAGHVRAKNGHCIWSGLYMNDITGYNMGWATTRFVAVDESAVAASGQYCLAREHGALYRPTRQK